MTIRSSTFSPVYNTNPDTNNLLVEVINSSTTTTTTTSSLPEANAGTNATKALAIQGIDSGKPIGVFLTNALLAGTNSIGSINNTQFGIAGLLPAFASIPTVNIGTIPAVTFTNTSFTANAGTNLNTSLLALESGNLANINTKLPSGLTVTSNRLIVDGSAVIQPVSFTSLPSGSNVIGSISNTSFSISGTPTVNIGTIPNITFTNTSIIANAGTNLNTSLLATEAGNLATINTKLPISLGAKPSANSLAVTLANDGIAANIDTKIGEVSSTPTANTVLGRLKAIVDALVFGPKSRANSISITDAKASTAPTTSIASNTTSTVLLNANSNRIFASFRNNSTSIAYIEFGPTATTSSLYKILPDGFMTFDSYVGVISCIWVSVNGNMLISEGV